MIKQRRQNASITIYFCLALVLIGALILGLVESLRWEGLAASSKSWTNLTVESLFAGYQPLLLKEYDMFFLDSGFGEGERNLEAAEEWMEALLYENVENMKNGDKGNFYRMQVSDVNIVSHTLATDGKGTVFIRQASETMKEVMGERAAKQILKKIQNIQNKEEEGGNPEQSITDAENTLIQLKAQESEMEANTKGVYRGADSGETLPANINNPIEDIKPVRSQGILTLVLPQGKTVSQKTTSVDNSLLRRSLQRGSKDEKVAIDWYDRILTQEFIKPLVGNFLSPKEGGLSYGVEYLICGKGSDKENLEGTVKKLLLLRETVNYLYLQTDEVKKAEALSVATILAGASANPALIELVKQGILAAWAYAESICDVKALLSGGKIPLQKNSGNWQMQISNLSGASTSEYRGEATGLSYEDYLDVFLYASSNQKMAYRAMDLMEWKLHKKEIYRNCKMDSMIVDMKIEAEFEAFTVFFDIFGEDTIGGYTFKKQAEYQYR